MANPARLTGTPWHAEKMTRAEGDPKRHRARCVNYNKATGRCSAYFEGCRGAAHCEQYSETVKAEQEPAPQKAAPTVQPNKARVGALVYSKAFGEGRVTGLKSNGSVIEVAFADKTRMFLLPKAFVDGLLEFR